MPIGHVLDWLNLLIRWIHVIAAMAWIGSSFFFMWLDSSLEPPAAPKENVKGELWMTHSGGFYLVEKRRLGPGEVPATLHWFKWEAGFTWLSGFSLLGVVYYLTGGIYLVDPAVSSLSNGAAIGVGLVLLIVSWAVYDFLWSSPLAGKFPSVISFALVVAVAFGLGRMFSGRAAFLHVGAMLGTLMAGNVWMRILPAQRQMIAATQAGQPADEKLGARAKRRSVHNNYMTFPVVFLMLSNHFPSTYGHPHPWLVLSLLVLAGAGVRHVMNVRKRSTAPILVGVAETIVSLMIMTAPATRRVAVAAPPVSANAKPIDPKQTGKIEGVIRFEGAPPVPKSLALPAGCGQPTASTNSVLVKDGRLANAFVWIADGLDDWAMPPVSSEAITINQKGCLYEPRVIGARVGQKVLFLNGDPILHNVHALADANVAFNEAMAGAGVKLTKIFDTPETMVHMKCDVHPWMDAFIGVLAHPFFAVSKDDGSLLLEGVPPGTYTVRAWHEVYGTREEKVVVQAGGGGHVDLTFTAN